MALVIPTSSQSDIISSLRSNNLTQASNSVFFGTGGLSGTIKNTTIDYNPVAAPILNPADFSDMNLSQVAALQGQINNQVDTVNLNKQKLLNQFNEARQNRLQQNQDTLATTQQLFSVVGGINPLQSGRNAAALTGMQAGVRNDLQKLFNTAREQSTQLDLNASQLGIQGLQLAIDANQKSASLNFDQGMQLSNALGTFVDQNGNLQTIAGQTNVPTLNSVSQQATISQNQQRLDLQKQQMATDLAGYVTGPNGEPAYKRADGTSTIDPNDPNIESTYLTTRKNPDGTSIYTTNPNDPNIDTSVSPVKTLFRNQAQLTNLINYQNALQSSYNSAQQAANQYGYQVSVDAKGNKTVAVNNMAKYGIDLGGLQKAYNSDIATGKLISDTIEQSIASGNDYGMFNKIFLGAPDTPGSVAFKTSNAGKAAGYMMFNVGDPKWEIPKEILDKLPAVPGTSDKPKLFIDYIRTAQINDQGVASLLKAAAATSGGKITYASSAEDIIKNFQTSSGSSEDKRLFLRAMVSAQTNSDFATITNRKDITKLGDELTSFVKDTLPNLLNAKYKEIEKLPNDKKAEYNSDRFLKEVLANKDGIYRDNNGKLTDVGLLFDGLVAYGNELSNNFGKDRQEEARSYFKATAGGVIGGVDSPNFSLIDSLIGLPEKTKTPGQTPSKNDDYWNNIWSGIWWGVGQTVYKKFR